MARATVNQAPDVALQGTAGFTGAHNFSIGKAYMANSICVVNNYHESLDTVPIDLVGHMVGGAAGGKAIDFKAIWETALAQRSKGTCNWFLESLEFQRLVEERGTFLWGTGMPGSGKTILISVCIERLQETFKNHQDVAIAYVYFRYSEQISWPDVLAAIIEQLAWSCNGAHDVLLAIYSERRNPRPTTRSERDLIAILQRIINNLNKVFIAIDGLDEVADETRVKLLEAFSSLDANILVTSRPLEPYASYAPKALWVPIQARTEDIGKLVEDRIQRNPRLKAILQGKPDLVKKLSDSIKEKSQGMFLLARLQMDALQSSNSINSLFRKLSSLPSGISAMYQQTLERINAQPEEDASIAHRVFLWLLHGFETLSVEGLQHALAVSLEDMSYDEGDVVSDSLLMSMCCGLVTTITIGSQPWEPQRREVRFIHYTTQEFLRSVAFPGFSNPHSLLSVACLGYLQAVNIESLFGEDTADLPYAAVATHPFLRYAYDNWGRHAKESERHGSLHQHTLSFLQRCNKFPLRVERPSKRYTFQSTVTRAWGLHLAAWWGLVGVISSGNLPCPPTATCDDFSPFHLAIGSAFSLPDSPDVPLMLEVFRALASSYGMSAGHIASRAFMGTTPLHLAVKCGSLECLKALISLVHSSEPLHVSNAEGSERMDVINIPNSLQETPLVCALSGADATTDMILLLISQPNTDPTVRDSKGNTALFYACSNVPLRPPGSDHIAVTLLSTFPYLISEACYSDGRNTNVFVEACLNNRNEAVTWLLNHDPALVHQVHPDTGETALIRVCKQGQWPSSIPMVEQLLMHGSDPSVRDSVERRSAFLWCLSPPRRHAHGKSLAPVIVALEKLVEHFPNPDLYKQRDKRGRTALMLAAMLEIPEAPIATFILSLPEIDLEYCNAHDNEGQTALTLACRNTREDVFRELIQSSLLLPSTIREGLIYAFENGFPGSAGAVLYELSMLPGLGVLNQGFEDYLSVILLAHAVTRACKRLILTLLMHVEGGAGARSPTNDRRKELLGICDCPECWAERDHEYYRSEPRYHH